MSSALHDRLAAAVEGRTYRAVGELTRTHPETVRRYMQGQSPSVEFLEALCTALKLSGDWVLTGRGPMHASDIRGHALKEAGAGDLFTAMATNMEQLVTRVERLERYAQSLENMVRAGGDGATGPAHDGAGLKNQARPQGAAEMNDVKPTPVDAGRRASSIADAIAERPREDAR